MEKNMKTAVITAGGLGTRLLTFTKVAPKAILPIYSKTFDQILHGITNNVRV